MESEKIVDYPIVMEDLRLVLSEVFVDAEEKAVKSGNKLDANSLLLEASLAVENYFKKKSLLSSELTTRLVNDATDLIRPYQGPLYSLALILAFILFFGIPLFVIVVLAAPIYVPILIFFGCHR